MKTTATLDYQAILANKPQPIHFALLFEAPESTQTRSQAAAFTIVLDRSGSMGGPPLKAAKNATISAVRNLRKGDLFSLVVFDDSARTVIPLFEITDKQAAISRINGISIGSCTNLTGGWMLGRDELKKAPADAMRRLLLLSDGMLNQGITEPDQVTGIVANGLEKDRIRSSCLGFGPHYQEDLMARLAEVTNGAFYDANSPDKLPGIFEAELDGLQQTVVMNLRVRLKALDFVDGVQFLGIGSSLDLPDGRREFALGDLTADETMAAVFKLDVLAIPNLEPGRPAATLEGESLVEVEILYDEVGKEEVKSIVETHTIRVRPTQDPADVRVDESALSWITPPQAARIVNEALAKRDAGEIDEARGILEAGIKRIQAYGQPDLTRDAIDLLVRTLRQISDDVIYHASRKSMRHSSSAYMSLRASQHWSGLEEERPSFSRRTRRRPDPDHSPDPEGSKKSK